MKIVLLGIAGLILVSIVVLLIMFRHEIKTLTTLKERENGVYTMTYDGDYGFTEFERYDAVEEVLRMN